MARFASSWGRTSYPIPHVWGWGGGTTFAELDLARRHGCHTVMLSGHDGRLEQNPSSRHHRVGPARVR